VDLTPTPAASFPLLAAALALEGFRVMLGARTAQGRPFTASRGRVRISAAPGQPPAMEIIPTRRGFTTSA